MMVSFIVSTLVKNSFTEAMTELEGKLFLVELRWWAMALCLEYEKTASGISKKILRN